MRIRQCVKPFWAHLMFAYHISIKVPTVDFWRNRAFWCMSSDAKKTVLLPLLRKCSEQALILRDTSLSVIARHFGSWLQCMRDMLAQNDLRWWLDTYTRILDFANQQMPSSGQSLEICKKWHFLNWRWKRPKNWPKHSSQKCGQQWAVAHCMPPNVRLQFSGPLTQDCIISISTISSVLWQCLAMTKQCSRTS